MAFNSDFWVAIATSAPVIGLGAVLPLANSLVSSVDPAGVAEALVEAMSAAGLVVAGIVTFGSGGWQCEWSTPEQGEGLICHKM